MAIRQRLDLLLVERQLAPSRERAQSLILAGKVLVNMEKNRQTWQEREFGLRIGSSSAGSSIC